MALSTVTARRFVLSDLTIALGLAGVRFRAVDPYSTARPSGTGILPDV